MNNRNARLLYQVIEECLDNLEERPAIETDSSPQDELIEILDRIGHEHRKWLTNPTWGRLDIPGSIVLRLLTDQAQLHVRNQES